MAIRTLPLRVRRVRRRHIGRLLGKSVVGALSTNSLKGAILANIEREEFQDKLVAIGWDPTEAKAAGRYCLAESRCSEHPLAERHCHDTALEHASEGQTFAEWADGRFDFGGSA